MTTKKLWAIYLDFVVATTKKEAEEFFNNHFYAVCVAQVPNNTSIGLCENPEEILDNLFENQGLPRFNDTKRK